MEWKKGKGKLGFLNPLLGEWQAQVESPMGKFLCKRSFRKILAGKYIELSAFWDIDNKPYEEIALIGVNAEKQVQFWSFTSDGKYSTGLQVDVGDCHPQAIGFEAQMPAGLARMAYWPDDNNGFIWVVESKTKKGWNRFSEHHYQTI